LQDETNVDLLGWGKEPVTPNPICMHNLHFASDSIPHTIYPASTCEGQAWTLSVNSRREVGPATSLGSLTDSVKCRHHTFSLVISLVSRRNWIYDRIR
jgi:hypothetical protein